MKCDIPFEIPAGQKWGRPACGTFFSKFFCSHVYMSRSMHFFPHPIVIQIKMPKNISNHVGHTTNQKCPTDNYILLPHFPSDFFPCGKLFVYRIQQSNKHLNGLEWTLITFNDGVFFFDQVTLLNCAWRKEKDQACGPSYLEGWVDVRLGSFDKLKSTFQIML